MFNIDGVAQSLEDIGIVLERSGLLFHHFVRLCHQAMLSLAMLVDVSHLIA